MEFADPKARVTRRLRHQGVDCQSMPTSHAAGAARCELSKARRADLSGRVGPHIGCDDSPVTLGSMRFTEARATLLDRAVRCRTRRGDGLAPRPQRGDRHGTDRGPNGPATRRLPRSAPTCIDRIATPSARCCRRPRWSSTNSTCSNTPAHTLDEVRRQEFFRAGAVMRQDAASGGCCCGAGHRARVERATVALRRESAAVHLRVA